MRTVRRMFPGTQLNDFLTNGSRRRRHGRALGPLVPWYRLRTSSAANAERALASTRKPSCSHHCCNSAPVTSTRSATRPEFANSHRLFSTTVSQSAYVASSTSGSADTCRSPCHSASAYHATPTFMSPARRRLCQNPASLARQNGCHQRGGRSGVGRRRRPSSGAGAARRQPLR